MGEEQQRIGGAVALAGATLAGAGAAFDLTVGGLSLSGLIRTLMETPFDILILGGAGIALLAAVVGATAFAAAVCTLLAAVSLLLRAAGHMPGRGRPAVGSWEQDELDESYRAGAGDLPPIPSGGPPKTSDQR